MSTAPEEKKPKEITAKMVKAALRNRKKGERAELTDGRCKGLQFRVSEDCAIWTVRARLQGDQRRWTIGNSDLSPDEARDRAGEVRAWCRRGSNPDKLVTQYMTGISMSKQIHFDTERRAPSWGWQQAVDNFLDHIRPNRAPETYDDYARTLGGWRRLDPKKRHAQVAELSRFKGKQVNTIAREDICDDFSLTYWCTRLAHAAFQPIEKPELSLQSIMGATEKRWSCDFNDLPCTLNGGSTNICTPN